MYFSLTTPRGNGKSESAMHDLWLVLLTHGKKKKSFLKWLRGFGFHKNVIESFEKWVINGKGKHSYDIFTFKYYWFTEYFYRLADEKIQEESK